MSMMTPTSSPFNLLAAWMPNASPPNSHPGAWRLQRGLPPTEESLRLLGVGPTKGLGSSARAGRASGAPLIPSVPDVPSRGALGRRLPGGRAPAHGSPRNQDGGATPGPQAAPKQTEAGLRVSLGIGRFAGDPQRGRSRPKRQDAALNPKVEGSNPSRPIAWRP